MVAKIAYLIRYTTKHTLCSKESRADNVCYDRSGNTVFLIDSPDCTVLMQCVKRETKHYSSRYSWILRISGIVGA